MKVIILLMLLFSLMACGRSEYECKEMCKPREIKEYSMIASWMALGGGSRCVCEELHK